jgi:peptide deformylase
VGIKGGIEMDIITIDADKKNILKTVCKPIESLNANELLIIERMKEILLEAYNGTGKGLAAPQVGINRRFFILRFGNRIETFINPEIIKSSSEKVTFSEGCLSVPGTYYKVSRSRRIEVRYYDETLIVRKAKFHDFDAVAFQHELDHLNGILICDKGKAA